MEKIYTLGDGRFTNEGDIYLGKLKQKIVYTKLREDTIPHLAESRHHSYVCKNIPKNIKDTYNSVIKHYGDQYILVEVNGRARAGNTPTNLPQLRIICLDTIYDGYDGLNKIYNRCIFYAGDANPLMFESLTKVGDKNTNIKKLDIKDKIFIKDLINNRILYDSNIDYSVPIFKLVK